MGMIKLELSYPELAFLRKLLKEELGRMLGTHISSWRKNKNIDFNEDFGKLFCKFMYKRVDQKNCFGDEDCCRLLSQKIDEEENRIQEELKT